MNVDAAWLVGNFPDLASLQQLGLGGQKLVFSATHPSDGDVVLKLIRPGQDAERVTREIEAVELVASPRVPRVLEKGTVASNIGPVVWVRETRVIGQSLRDALKLSGSLPLPDALRLAVQILEPLADAERLRIVHRDVKPDNIMVDNQGDFWLLDFGLARHLDLSSLTATANHFGVGTPGYAAPEQFRNKKSDIDVRADLFSLGVTLHEVLTGANPLLQGARDVLEVIRRTENVPLPRTPGPNDVADFIATMARPWRDHRPGSAAEALEWAKELAARHAGP